MRVSQLQRFCDRKTKGTKIVPSSCSQARRLMIADHKGEGGQQTYSHTEVRGVAGQHSDSNNQFGDTCLMSDKHDSGSRKLPLFHKAVPSELVRPPPTVRYGCKDHRHVFEQ